MKLKESFRTETDDFTYEEIMKVITSSGTADELAFIYDFSKRIYNDCGMGFKFVKKVYLLGTHKDYILKLSKKL